MSRLKDLWASGGAAVNGLVVVAGVICGRGDGAPGLDSLTIDMQHGPIDLADAVPMLQAMAASDVTPVVRVPWNEPSVMMRVLDAGAYGLSARW